MNCFSFDNLGPNHLYVNQQKEPQLMQMKRHVVLAVLLAGFTVTLPAEQPAAVLPNLNQLTTAEKAVGDTITADQLGNELLPLK